METTVENLFVLDKSELSEINGGGAFVYVNGEWVWDVNAPGHET